MAKQIDIEIHESEKELLSLLGKQSKLLQRQRVKALVLIKQGKVRYSYELSNKLKRERKTIYNWLKLYQEEGLSGYLNIKIRGSRKEQITDQIKAGLEEKLATADTNITSYVELLLWVEETYEVRLKYKTLYSHCRNHLKSKLKVARKSHHKKDDQAVEAFKKNYQTYSLRLE